MDRREALKAASCLVGYAMVGSSAAILLDGCKADISSDWVPAFLTHGEAELVAEICELILPKTDTPGARDAACERYVDQAIHAFYKPEAKEKFRLELTIFDDNAKNKYSKAFLALNKNEKERVMEIVVKNMKEHEQENKEGKHIFRILRELTVSGYCTSEVGAKGGLLEYRPIPGPYQGCIEYNAIGKTWAL
jgi:gluconate 2-dehydrogenase gamma chain